MPDLLSTSVSGLLAARTALDVTGQNIANVSTEGYSRQSVEFVTRPPQGFGNGWLGSGVDVDTVRRVYDDFLAQQTRSGASSLGRLDTYASLAERLGNLFANPETGVGAAMSQFGAALQGLSADPASLSARQSVLSQANVLSDRLRLVGASVASLDAEINGRIDSETGDVNALAQAVAKLNTRIAQALGSTGQPPNDLLDQRDRLVDQLSQHVNVSVVPQADGMQNVFIGSGQALVLGANAAQLTSIRDAYDPTRRTVALSTPSGNVDISSSVTGGSLGGLLDFRRQMLDPARNELGRVAASLAGTVNAQHAAGIDLSGTLGGQFFRVGGADVLANSANGGNATVAATRTDDAALTGANYLLTKTAGGWSLQREDTGAAVTLTGTGTAADPLIADGVSLVVSGNASSGDRFLVAPTRSAVGGFSVAIGDPSRIAAAAPIRTAVAAGNLGSATISAGSVVDATNPALRSAVTIRFTSPNTYSINGAGNFAYASGGDIDVNGWRVQIGGVPATGDTFTVKDNTGGNADNRNALALSAALGKGVLDGGATSVSTAASRLVGRIATGTQNAQINRDAQAAVQADNVKAMSNKSGVNLDEEAASLMRYQQMYQAAAQAVKVAQTCFDTLLAATRN